jgi:2-haloacid dehalogenase
MTLRPLVVLFDLGGVLFDYQPERRETILAELCGDRQAASRFLRSDLPRRLDLGEASEAELGEALGKLCDAPMPVERARSLWLSVLRPRAEVWRLFLGLRPQARIGVFSNNPGFVAEAFPPGAVVDHLLLSSGLKALKPERAAFEAAQAELDAPAGAVLFVDDGAANVARAAELGWRALPFRSVERLAKDLAAQGLG